MTLSARRHRHRTATLVLFLEYLPQTMSAWLHDRIAADDVAADRTYDHTYTTTYLAQWLGKAYADTVPPTAVADVINEHAKITALTAPFYEELQQVSRSTPYPVPEIEATFPDAPHTFPEPVEGHR